jgi:hypothetical protein
MVDEVRPRQCPCLRAFKLWCDQGIRRTRRRSDDTGKHRFYPGSAPLLGNGLRPACLTLLLGCLQRGRRLDLAEGVELSRIRALRWMVEKCLERGLGSPSQPFICEGWVSGLLSKLTTYKGGR